MAKISIKISVGHQLKSGKTMFFYFQLVSFPRELDPECGASYSINLYENSMAKPQSKTQKRIDNNIRLALTEVCEQFLDNIHGFQWLTHQANYSDFPGSLLISCVFDTRESQQHAIENGNCDKMQKIIQAKLLKTGVKFKALQQQIIFDSEQACSEEQEGKWALRLASRDKLSATKKRGK